MLASVDAPFVNPLSDEQKASGRLTQARDAKRRKIVQMLAAQDVFHRDMLNETLPPNQRASAATAYINLEDRIRILKGKPLPGVLKPGDRISRRTKHKALQSPLSPYLADHTSHAPEQPSASPSPTPTE